MFQVSTFQLPWQCPIVRCPSCKFAISCMPTAFTSQCPLQGCPRIQSHCRCPRPRRSNSLPRPDLEAVAVGLKTRASENLEKQEKQDRQPLKSASTMRSQGPRPHWVLSSPTVPLFSPGWRPHFWFLRPPSPTCRERGDRRAHSRTMGSVAPQEAVSVIRIHDRILPEPGPKSVTRPCVRGTGTRPTVRFLPACQRTPRLPGRSCQ